jgi:protein-tyrosine phosphatase
VIYLPHNVISPVTDDISIGGLRAYGELPELKKFGLVLNVAWELADGYDKSKSAVRYESYPLSNGVVVHNARLDDNEEVEEQVPEILRAVGMVNAARARGERVLVTCAQGRNRSALVIAEHLIQAGAQPNEVIERIRAARDRSLLNDAFVAWLRRAR